MCKYQENDEVRYSLDSDPDHVYIVRDSTEMPGNGPCTYHLELKNDKGVQMLNISESYMTDTVPPPKDKTKRNASASS